MTKADLFNLFTAVGNAHNAATRTLIANGPGPKYDAAADAADALEATLEVACDEYNAANPAPLSIPVF
jgi:hypothetical protein